MVTNLFPPQEMGGYGRKLWEFAALLRRRGHEIAVLTGDAAYLARAADGDAGLDDVVHRDLELFGRYEGGVKIDLEQAAIQAIVRSNAQKTGDWAERFRPDACLVGNLDLIGYVLLQKLLALGLPVVHSMGLGHPGYPPAVTPRTPLYRPAPASGWLGGKMTENGYAFERRTVLYPGARVPFFWREPLPERDLPRIVYAGLVMPYKGADLLVGALDQLYRNGIDFHCTFAGDTLSKKFVDEIKAHIAAMGYGDKVEFPGFLDRSGLARLFARSNVLVFPSTVDETFGIAPVEAMAAGLTVVTSATGGQAEVIRDGIDGLHFTRDKPLELARALVRLTADRGLWQRLAQAGRERALAFDVARSVDVLEDTFAEMLASS